MTGDNQDVLEFLNQTKSMYDEDSTNYKICEQAIAAVTGIEKAAKKLAYIHQCIDLYGDREELHDESYWLDYILDPEWIDTDIGWDGYEMKPTDPNQSEFPTRCDHTAEVSKKVSFTEEERRMLKKMRTLYNGTYADLLDRLVASALEDADSAYTEGYTAAESKYRALMGGWEIFIVQKFHDYQIEWLKSHYDLELEPQLEELIIRFLHDTANMYMLDAGRKTDETD